MTYFPFEDWQHDIDSPHGIRYRAQALRVLVQHHRALRKPVCEKLAEVALGREKLNRATCNWVHQHIDNVGDAVKFDHWMAICSKVVQSASSVKGVKADLFIDFVVSQLKDLLKTGMEEPKETIVVDDRVLKGTIAQRAVLFVRQATSKLDTTTAIFSRLYSVDKDAWCCVLELQDQHQSAFLLTSPAGNAIPSAIGNKLLIEMFGKVPNYFYFLPLSEEES